MTIFSSSLNVTSIKDGHIEGRINPARKFAWNLLRMEAPTLGCHTYKKSLSLECGGYTMSFPGYEDWELLLRMSIHDAIPFECAGPGLIHIPRDSSMAGHTTLEQEVQGERMLSSVRSSQS